MNNMYAVLVLVVITSISSTLCFSSNNAGDHQEIFMVVDNETTFHDAAMGMSKANPVQIGNFRLKDGKALALLRGSSPSRNCVSEGQPCGLLDWCCEDLSCNDPFYGRCYKDCISEDQPCGLLDWCCTGLSCDGVIEGKCHPSTGCREPGTLCSPFHPCCPNHGCVGYSGVVGTFGICV